MKKNFNLSLLVIGFIVYVICSIIARTSQEYYVMLGYAKDVLAGYSVIFDIAIIMMLAFCLTKSKTLNYVGYAIGAIIGVFSIEALVCLGETDINEFSLLLPYFGSLVMTFTSVLFFVGLCLKFFGFVKSNQKEQSSDSKIELLRLYAELSKDELISEEDFAIVKSNIISGDLKNSKEKLVELGNLKKLYDEQIITKEEFVTFTK